MFYVYDGDSWLQRYDLKAATKAAEDALGAARENCDPEWPCTVDEIAIYEAPPGCADPDEDGQLIAGAAIAWTRPAGEGDPPGVNFMCDYEITELETRLVRERGEPS